jgi:hypothetical protein
MSFSSSDHLIPSKLHQNSTKMDGSKKKKPSLSRLATRLTNDDREQTGLPNRTFAPLGTGLTNRSVAPELQAKHLAAHESRMAPKIPAEISIDQLPKPERQAIAPFLFPEQDKDDENVAPIEHDVQESKPAYVSYKTFDEESPTTTQRMTMHYEDDFAIRGSHNSPKERVARDSLVVAELTTNLKVCCPMQTHLIVSLTSIAGGERD